MNIKERLNIARAMIKHGDDFTKSLGESLLYGNSLRAEEVKALFPKNWEHYQKLSLKDRGVYA